MIPITRPTGAVEDGLVGFPRNHRILVGTEGFAQPEDRAVAGGGVVCGDTDHRVFGTVQPSSFASLPVLIMSCQSFMFCSPSFIQ